MSRLDVNESRFYFEASLKLFPLEGYLVAWNTATLESRGD